MTYVVYEQPLVAISYQFHDSNSEVEEQEKLRNLVCHEVPTMNLSSTLDCNR